jgi:hypothetical protein
MNIIGHERERQDLRRIAESDIVPQSYLFFGPRHVGKSLVAREFAALLMDPRGTVPIFETASDFLMIAPEEIEHSGKRQRLAIPVEAVRDAGVFLSRYPSVSKRRVLIINEAEFLTQAAENALLKLIEEPNSTSVIILITHQPGRLLPTVVSRLVPVAFRPVPAALLQQTLGRGVGNTPDFFLTLGQPGIVMGSAGESETFSTKKEILRDLFRLSRLSWRDRIVLAERLSYDEASLKDILEIWLVGLQNRNHESSQQTSRAYFFFLEKILTALGRLDRKEGTPRLILEQMFTSL